MVHAIPIPRKTLTALEPVTLPTELSAVSSSIAAVLEAKVSVKMIIWGKKFSRNLLARSHNLGSAVIVKYIPRNDRETCWGSERSVENVWEILKCWPVTRAISVLQLTAARCPRSGAGESLVTRQHLTLHRHKTHLHRKNKNSNKKHALFVKLNKKDNPKAKLYSLFFGYSQVTSQKGR